MLRVVRADGDADRSACRAGWARVSFGLAPEHVAAESMSRDRGYWWAQDGRQVLLARVDTASVQRCFADAAKDPAGRDHHPAPPASTANAEVSVDRADVDGLPDCALTAVDWDATAFGGT